LALLYLNQPKYATFWLHATHIWGYCFLVSSPADAALFKLEVAKQPLKLLPSASMIRIDKARQNDASNLESDDTDILIIAVVACIFYEIQNWNFGSKVIQRPSSFQERTRPLR
jgi:hypothetical protein